MSFSLRPYTPPDFTRFSGLTRRMSVSSLLPLDGVAPDSHTP